MSTVNTFTEMSGITHTSALEITPERAQEVIYKTVSSNPRDQTTSTPITLLQVSTYVAETKEEMLTAPMCIPDNLYSHPTEVSSSATCHEGERLYFIWFFVETGQPAESSLRLPM